MALHYHYNMLIALQPGFNLPYTYESQLVLTVNGAPFTNID